MPFSIFNYVKVIYDTKSTIDFLRKRNLLRKRYFCCSQECHIKKVDTLSDLEISKCKVCKKKKSIRVDSFFSKSKLPLHVLFSIMYLFIKDTTLVQAGKFMETEVSTKSIRQFVLNTYSRTKKRLVAMSQLFNWMNCT